MTMTPDQLRAAVVANNPGRDWDQACQAFVWQSIKASRGGNPHTYASAKAARLASKIVSKDMNAAPPGAIHYWIIGTYDHDGVALGNGLVAYATAKGDTVESWGKNLKVSHASSYPATYAGWSNGNGDLGAVDVSAYTVTLTGSQRQVLSTLPVKRRSAPSSQSAEAGAALDPGTVGNFTGWIHGENVSGNDVWFQGTSGNWFWSGGFTDTGTHDLADLNPVVNPTATQRKVLATAPANKRSDPSTANASTGQFAPNTIVDMVGFITGENVSGNATWFKSADGSFTWSGGYTDSGAHDLTDLSAPPVVIPPVVTDITRVIGATVTNHRAIPSTTSPTLSPTLAAGSTQVVVGYAHGQVVAANDVWFKLQDASWAWSGAFTSQDVTGLTDLTSSVVVPPPIVPTTFGIDISKVQGSMNFVQAKAEGVSFVIVKQGGYNVTPLYTSSTYVAQVAAARAAGLKIGHYWLIGGGATPQTQAAYFVANLSPDFDVKNDVLALDNEKLDSNGTQWKDQDVAAFFKAVIALTGIKPSQLWHYANASDYRGNGPWTETEALGVKVWWAAYGSNPTVRIPDAEPSLQGAVAGWWVHQFSSKQTVAGVNVDGNWSTHTIDELFPTVAVTPPVVTPPVTDNSAALVAALSSLVTTQNSVITALQSNVEDLKKAIDDLGSATN